MKPKLFALMALCLALTACENYKTDRNAPNNPNNPNRTVTPGNPNTNNTNTNRQEIIMKKVLLVASMCLALAACDNRSNPNKTDMNRSASIETRDNASYASDYRSDNTGRNVRDRDNTLTPGNQSESEADRTITQRIRQALMEDASLSTNAKNIKVITINGVVTLRGPVNNEREKNSVAQKVRAVSGVRNVDNQIEIVSRQFLYLIGFKEFL